MRKPAGDTLKQPAAGGGSASPAQPSPAGAPGGSAPALEADAPAAAQTGPILSARLIVEWRAGNGGMAVYTLAPEEIIALAGPDPRLLLPWVLYALKTGQVFGGSPGQVSREKVESLLRGIIKESGPRKEARISAEERTGLHEQNKGQPPGKILLGLQKNFKIGSDGVEQAGELAGGISGLQNRLGAQLQPFILNPNQEGFRPYLAELSPEEKQAVRVLNRVAKTQ